MAKFLFVALLVLVALVLAAECRPNGRFRGRMARRRNQPVQQNPRQRMRAFMRECIANFDDEDNEDDEENELTPITDEDEDEVDLVDETDSTTDTGNVNPRRLNRWNRRQRWQGRRQARRFQRRGRRPAWRFRQRSPERRLTRRERKMAKWCQRIEEAQCTLPESLRGFCESGTDAPELFPDRFGFGFGNPWLDFSIRFGNKQQANWWEGPNVCEIRTGDVPPTKTEEGGDDDEEEEGEISHHHYARSESCDISQTAYKCTSTISRGGITKTMTVIKECCHGYARKEIDHGCPRELQLKNLLDTANDLGLTAFVDAVSSVQLTGELQTGNFTVFAPTDEAFEDLGEALPVTDGFTLQDMNNVVMVSKPMMDQMTDSVTNILLGHLTTDVLKSTALRDEQLINTLSLGQSTIRINFYDVHTKVVTANCRRVTSVDNVATNGVIHVVEKILSPVTETIVDIISRNPDLSYLKTALGRVELSSALREDGQYTIYAPTDTAFRKLDESLLAKLMSQPECLTKVLKNHVLPNVICSAAIQGKARTENLLKSYLHLNRDENNKLFVQEKQIVASDIMATNGVIHLIDDVLLTDEALGILDLIEKENATMILQLINASGLVKTLKTAENITFFVPTNEALSKLDPDVMNSLTTNTEDLRSLLTYHVSPGIKTAKDLYNNQQLETLNEDQNIRINEYLLHFPRRRFSFNRRRVKTAQCAPVSKSCVKSCNGIIHFVDQVLMPPRGNVLDVVSQDSRFTTFVQLLKDTGLADSIQGNDGPFTIFAPTNQAIENISDDLEDFVLRNPRRLKALLKSHIAKGAICCVAIRPGGWLSDVYIHMLSGDRLVLDTNESGMKSVGGSMVGECDMSATNGVVHAIDDVITASVPTKKRERTGDIWDSWDWRFPDWW